MVCRVMRWTATLVLLASLLPARDCSQDIIKDVTLGFGEALKHCREESNLTEEMMEEFFFFWRDDFDFTMRELGCAIKCMGKYFDLLTSEHRMHRENTESFIKSFPNGEALSKQMTDIIRECEVQHDEHEDHCWRILKVAECFKNTCKKLGIAPSMEVVMVELMMEAN